MIKVSTGIMRRLGWLVAALLVWGVTLPVWAADPEVVYVFAAASTTNAVAEACQIFTAQSQVRAVPSFASSSTLAKQIAHGAPANVFISANVRWMDYLAERGLIQTSSRVNLFQNRLVLIAPARSNIQGDVLPGFPLKKWLGEGRLAMGDPSHVPAGIYAKAALEKLGVWADCQAKTAPAATVRAALALVERGETPLGVVYATDAVVSKKVRVVGMFPEDSHPPIVYPAALIVGHDSPGARSFMEFLQGPEARAVFSKYGFR